MIWIFMKGFILSIFFLLSVSCQPSITYDCSGNAIQGRVSNSVLVENNFRRGTSPVIRTGAVRGAVCRKGFPDNYILPWDEALIQRGLGDGVEVNQQEGGDDNREDPDIRIDVGEYWVSFSPLIDNQTPFNLVVTDIEVKVSSSSEDVEDRSFEGSYCEGTDFLYWIEPGEAITPVNRSQSFHRGNLVFYLDGLTPPEDQNQNDQNFQLTTSSSFRVRYKINGYFACNDGSQRAGFERIEGFDVLPASF